MQSIDYVYIMEIHDENCWRGLTCWKRKCAFYKVYMYSRDNKFNYDCLIEEPLQE
ncbi:protein of unknown function [Bacillus velezensis UCMB5033]|nr:protein of unknown function [Bacillus velezensis UCMB5033]